jgi:hypothetical protein
VPDSDWKSTPSFPIFWSNALTFVAGGGGVWRPAEGSLLNREQSTIPTDSPTPVPSLDSLAGSRKLRFDEWLLAVAAILMISAWWSERRSD